MQLHVLHGETLPSPLLDFNEARRNIMQMILNGPIPPLPSSSSSSPCLPTFFFCPPQHLICLCPFLFPFLFNFMLNAFPYFLIVPKLTFVFVSPALFSSSLSPFQKMRSLHWHAGSSEDEYGLCNVNIAESALSTCISWEEGGWGRVNTSNEEKEMKEMESWRFSNGS